MKDDREVDLAADTQTRPPFLLMSRHSNVGFGYNGERPQQSLVSSKAVLVFGYHGAVRPNRVE
jgi:hypothetical protein